MSNTEHPDNSQQLHAPSYLLPVRDTDFIANREELRGLRFALEYSKADLVLHDWGVRSTVIVFGSARIPSPEVAAERIASAAPGAPRIQAEKLGAWSRYYQEARAFAKLVSEEGGALKPVEGWRDNVIATGGGPGIMEAANRGAHDAGAPSIGFNITLPGEQQPNAYSTPDLTFRFHYFAMRKMHLAMRARALAVFPGGFGTMDELFEVLTLQQTQKASVTPVVLVGKDYWESVVNFDAMIESGLIEADDLKIFDIVDTGAEAWAALKARGLKPASPARRRPVP
ncbi:MAG: LOG family protein [Proteobacteria bacterium]|nr:LOG family protein [Pseudomonadota bacterium]